MNTTVESLQALYVAKGGEFSEVENLNTIPEMIDAIASMTEESTEGSVPISSSEVDEIINSVA